MSGPPWLDRVFAMLCALVAAYFLTRLALARRAQDQADRSGDVAHLVMGAGMAAMFLPAADPLPRPVWIAMFVVTGAWIAATLLRSGRPEPTAIPARRGRHLHLVISNAAMTYMVAAVGAPMAAQTAAVALPVSGTVVLAHDHGAGGGDLAALTVVLTAISWCTRSGPAGTRCVVASCQPAITAWCSVCCSPRVSPASVTS
jgi:hypothetical protein